MPTYSHRFETHVGLVINWKKVGVNHRVTIEGDTVKTLYEGSNSIQAKAVYDYTVEHYNQRAIARELDELNDMNEERLVPYVRLD